MTKKKEAAKKEAVTIAPPNIQTAVFKVRGTSPYVQSAFPAKAQQQIKETQEAGSTAKKGKKHTKKDFQECYEQAKHVAEDGWNGIPANGIRASLISACRLCGFQMTRAKLSVFVEADGFSKGDGTPMVKFTKGKPHYTQHYVRLPSGVPDIHARAMWDAGWEADLRLQFDADQFTVSDLANLLMRVGIQVGWGEGRPDSKKSCGMGWGLFEIIK